MQTPITSFAETVKISITQRPSIDIFLTSKETKVDIENFEEDITKSIKEKGVDTSDIIFTTVNRESSETSAI